MIAPGTDVKPPKISTGRAFRAITERLNCTPRRAPQATEEKAVERETAEANAVKNLAEATEELLSEHVEKEQADAKEAKERLKLVTEQEKAESEEASEDASAASEEAPEALEEATAAASEDAQEAPEEESGGQEKAAPEEALKALKEAPEDAQEAQRKKAKRKELQIKIRRKIELENLDIEKLREMSKSKGIHVLTSSSPENLIKAIIAKEFPD